MAEKVCTVCQVSDSSSSGSRAIHCPDFGESMSSLVPLRVSTRVTTISENSFAILSGSPTVRATSRARSSAAAMALA